MIFVKKIQDWIKNKHAQFTTFIRTAKNPEFMVHLHKCNVVICLAEPYDASYDLTHKIQFLKPLDDMINIEYVVYEKNGEKFTPGVTRADNIIYDNGYFEVKYDYSKYDNAKN